jgi:hypothetical protein
LWVGAALETWIIALNISSSAASTQP